jgi:NAD(P)-dependent dehydrogenase (short-subunit alcohol dehydrogenase family)
VSFEGQIAVVTGATSGIGAAVARALADAGATVHGLGRRAAEEAGIIAHRVDLADDAAVAGSAAGLADGIDLLVHAAGVWGAGTVAETPVEELERQWRINVRAPYLLTRALLPAGDAKLLKVRNLLDQAGVGATFLVRHARTRMLRKTADMHLVDDRLRGRPL